MLYIVGPGYIGQSLADYFGERGFEMRVLGRAGAWPVFHERDCIINCAASGYRRKVYDTKQTVNDNLLLPMLLSDRRNGANLIHFGSWTEECDPHSDYSRSKALATSYLEGKAHICMTCSVWGGKHESKEKFMGTFLKACAANEPYTITHPFRRRDFVHIDQFCRSVEELVSTRDYAKRYFATGKLRSFWSVYVELCNMTGKQFPNVKFVDDTSTSYDWWVDKPEFEDTFGEDLQREWGKLCG